MRFVIFFFKFTMCDVAPYSAINISLFCSWFDVFVIKIHHRLCLLWCCLQINFPPFSSCRSPFLCCYSFFNNFISSCYLCYFCSLVFIPWFSHDILSLHVRVCHSNRILVHLHLLYYRITFTCACTSSKFCRYPFIGFYVKEFLSYIEFIDIDCLFIQSYFT